MAKLMNVEIQKGGGGFGAPDVSDDLADMRNYEAAIMNEKIFRLLSQLKVMTSETDKSKYQYLVLGREDIEDFDARSMGAAGHGINSQFAVLGAPYRAIPFADNTVKPVERVTRTGKTVKGKETNCIKIYRTDEEFDSSLYAVADWGKLNDEGEELTYESYTVGQAKRAEKFLQDVDANLLKAVGISVTEE